MARPLVPSVPGGRGGIVRAVKRKSLTVSVDASLLLNLAASVVLGTGRPDAPALPVPAGLMLVLGVKGVWGSPRRCPGGLPPARPAQASSGSAVPAPQRAW